MGPSWERRGIGGGQSRSPSVVPLQSEASASPYVIGPTRVHTGLHPQSGRMRFLHLSPYKLLKGSLPCFAPFCCGSLFICYGTSLPSPEPRRPPNQASIPSDSSFRKPCGPANRDKLVYYKEQQGRQYIEKGY